MKNIAIATLMLIWGTASAQKSSSGNGTCTYQSTGKNTYFILEPGYQLTLKGTDDGNEVVLVITVLKETKIIGGVETRVVEENESENGKTVEKSYNYFAICKESNTVYYFGEDVDMYKDGKVVGHEGSWLAEGKNKAGIAMQGKFVPGTKYAQEIAPGVAMDKGEIVSAKGKMNTPAGNFTNCLKVKETNALKPKEKEYKVYAPGIGLIQDDKLTLVKYGFISSAK
ncbi:MAG: hypothetical protein JWQ38_3661 [Flavipsychrobacter sp.]|nr:hypothetical protein [Flavipsychrobacter sp.]